MYLSTGDIAKSWEEHFGNCVEDAVDKEEMSFGVTLVEVRVDEGRWRPWE